MSDFDRDSLFSDIDKIMEQQGYSNISASTEPMSTPVEVEASLEPDPQAPTPQDILNKIEAVIHPEDFKEEQAKIEQPSVPEDEMNSTISAEDITIPEPDLSEETLVEPTPIAEKVVEDIEEPVGPAVSTFSSTADIVRKEPEVKIEKDSLGDHSISNETEASPMFTTIEKPMEWSLDGNTEPADMSMDVDNTPAVSYLEGASSDGIPVENVAFGDISVGVETESVEFSVGHPLIRLFRNILIVVALALILSLFITKFVAHHTAVDGSSMSPTLTDGDQLIVEELSYYFHEPERFDIVVFPISTEDDYIKRIIGLPGETVQIMNGQVYINGNLLTEDRYGAETIEDPGTAADTIYLQPDEYFVLGDNRNASVDSRFPEVGLIHKKDIEGRAWLRFYPFGSFGSVK